MFIPLPSLSSLSSVLYLFLSLDAIFFPSSLVFHSRHCRVVFLNFTASEVTTLWRDRNVCIIIIIIITGNIRGRYLAGKSKL